MKEELDKIEWVLEAVDFGDLKNPAYQDLLRKNGMQASDVWMRIRPRLEKALNLLEQHELLNSLDDGNAGFITPKER